MERHHQTLCLREPVVVSSQTILHTNLIYKAKVVSQTYACQKRCRTVSGAETAHLWRQHHLQVHTACISITSGAANHARAESIIMEWGVGCEPPWISNKQWNKLKLCVFNKLKDPMPWGGENNFVSACASASSGLTVSKNFIKSSIMWNCAFPSESYTVCGQRVSEGRRMRYFPTLFLWTVFLPLHCLVIMIFLGLFSFEGSFYNSL
jgi:hypothetical protein